VLACAAAKKATDGDEDKKKEDVGTVIGIDLGTTYSW
jgi:molecular chaperone DnaK (HSP70)